MHINRMTEINVDVMCFSWNSFHEGRLYFTTFRVYIYCVPARPSSRFLLYLGSVKGPNNSQDFYIISIVLRDNCYD